MVSFTPFGGGVGVERERGGGKQVKGEVNGGDNVEEDTPISLLKQLRPVLYRPAEMSHMDHIERVLRPRPLALRIVDLELYIRRDPIIVLSALCKKGKNCRVEEAWTYHRG